MWRRDLQLRGSNSGSNSGSGDSGFTLVELVLVLVVLSTALAIAAPTLGGWRRGQRLRDAGEQFLAVARHGRSLAIADSRIHRLFVDPAGGRYWLMAQDGQQFVNLGTALGQVQVLPAGYAVQMTHLEQRAPLEFVEFYPSGRTHPRAAVTITSEDGSSFVLECPSPAEGFTLATGGGAL